MEHECKELDFCICDIRGYEPHEDCPIHGSGPPWPPRCMDCGRFLPWTVRGYIYEQAIEQS